MGPRLKRFLTTVGILLVIAGTPARGNDKFAQCFKRAVQSLSGDRSRSVLPATGRAAQIGAHFDHKEVFGRLLKSSKMVYHDEKLPLTPEGREFHASNEFDWFRTPTDTTKTGTLIGFGTNSAWDLAIRKDAKHLVIGDWHIGPLLTQEYLLRPLILQARTPHEFLSLLTGVRIPESLKARDISETFAFIDEYLHANREFDAKRIDFVRETLAKMGDNPKVTDDQLRGVASFYTDLANTRDGRPIAHFGPITGNFPSMIRPWIQDGRGPLFDFFRKRYDPRILVFDGADSLEVHSPYFSAFSSQQAFQRLQHLFDGHIQYAHTGFDDPSFYAALQNQLGAGSPQGFTLSITNIIDCIDGTVCGQTNQLKKILSTARDRLATPQAPLTVFRSTNTRPPHGFYRYEVKPDTSLEQEIQKVEKPRPEPFHSVLLRGRLDHVLWA